MHRSFDHRRLAGQKVLVMGLARSGRAAAQLAVAAGAVVHVVDVRRDLQAIDGTTSRLGPHQAEDFEQADVVVVSPGIPASNPWLRHAHTAGASVIGELGFASAFVQSASVPMVAVTGTNGKSSTVSFTAQLAEAAGRTVFAGGNLGRPLSELALLLQRGQPAPDLAVVEVSSYQLELPGPFAPSAAAVLNLTPDHLARHGTLECYGETKLRVFDRMGPGDTAWMPADVVGLPTKALASRSDGPSLLFLDGHPGVQQHTGAISFHGTRDDGTLDTTAFRLPGQHNQDNLAAAAGLLISVGIKRTSLQPDVIQALPHRLEAVHCADGVQWINDSKATNVEAAETGILAMSVRSVILLGGRGKEGANYAALRTAIEQGQHRVVCFGESGADIARALAHSDTVVVSGGLAEAVEIARASAPTDGAVLLSPACASFDEFTNFEARGRAFTALAQGQNP